MIAAPPVDPGPLPPPEALTAVMYRLADPAVPGADKLLLVQDTAPVDAATFETFAAALRDGGFTPITFTATDIRPADTRPDDVLATIGVTTSNPDDPGEFSFPMEFRTGGDGWQLTRETADMLLAFGSTRGGADLPAPPGPPR